MDDPAIGSRDHARERGSDAEHGQRSWCSHH
jgi:hypothetical protein